MIILGAIVLVPAFLALAILVAVWRAWWLHPLWALVLVPLGVPQIGFWHFLALGMFLHSWLAWKANTDNDNGKKKDWSQIVASFVVVLVWPVITFYIVRWYLL